MATHDFRQFEDDSIVVHYGGAITSVDAYTFANSLVAFADTARAVNDVLNPGQAIEIRLEAVGPGSYRAVVRRIKAGIGGFFSRGSEAIFWGLVATAIYESAIKDDPKTVVTVKTEEVIIETGRDRVIVPRVVYDQMPNVRSNPEVRRGISRTFEILDQDDAITDFGLTPRLTDAEPILQVQRLDFARLAEQPSISTEGEKRRKKRTKGRVLILKAWLNHASRKWTFQWNDVPIAAPIKDANFLDKIERREILIGAGDALEAYVSYEQVYNEELEIYENDPSTYEIAEVVKFIPRFGGKQSRLDSL